MRRGEAIAERFEIEQRVGSGGMGVVYRARDRHTGGAVAVKVLLGRHAKSAARFGREADVLASLYHPGIVRHIAHGIADSGAPYLTMEWLEGEDLGHRLERASLTVDQTMTLAVRVADALAAVHARGIVHRDLKPSNLFLVEGDVDRVKLLDFGIARVAEATPMTQAGALVGTLGYMAPEQARSEGQIDARADVFSLGCVLFECLTGVPAFPGEHIMGVLAKILFAEIPRVREIRPEVPAALDALCARMLAKNPDERLRDGAEVVAALDAIGRSDLVPAAAPVPASQPASGLTQKERRVLSLVLISPEYPADGGVTSAAGETMASPDALRRAVQAHGGHLELMADGSIMVTVVGTGVATDQAAQAARCALDLRAEIEGQPMALSTGWAEVAGRLPVGDVIDRAVRMLAETAQTLRALSLAWRAAPIVIDEVTAGLLDARFDVAETDAGLWLRREEALGPGARMLLGTPTACVGRDVELGILAAFFAECVDEPRSYAVLVTAPAGMGKTRVAHELLRRVEAPDKPITIWIGRGDPLRRGAAFGLLGQALAGACGLKDGEPIEVRREKILGRARELLGKADARRVAEFLGEIVGTPFPEEDSVPLRVARQDAQLMGEQMRRAWVDFLGAQCSRGPVLLLLEDLHWGDLPTVRFIDEALRRLKHKPWMVLALARPEVHGLFPNLWAERNLQEVRLGELSPKASARLVRQVLGEGVSAEALERLVAQADGNVFYLEELIRAVAEGSREALPDTVIAMVQSRLDALDSDARRVLRAASVFGQTFWRNGVEVLLGGEDGAPALDAQLARLARLEWIHARQEAKFQGEQEISFRHMLVREAAYSMLTEEDRALGHRLAGGWLEQVGEHEAAVIAEHFERGGDRARAALGYQRAAAEALAGNDLGAVLSWTERALRLDSSGPARGEIALLRAEALRWRGENAEAATWAEEAMEARTAGSARWYDAVCEMAWAVRLLGQRGRLAALAEVLASAWSDEDATGPAVLATARVARHLLLLGLYDQAEALHQKFDPVAERFARDPVVTGQVFSARRLREHFAGHLGRARDLAEFALTYYERAGYLRDACIARINLAYTECILGAYADAARLLRVAIADAERMGLEGSLALAQSNLGRSLSRLGAIEEARVMAAEAVAAAAAQGDLRLEGNARTYLAGILRSAGELEQAEAVARQAVALLAVVRPLLVLARGTLADVLIARGQAAPALAEAREAMALLASLGKVEEGEALARLTYAEALSATGDHAAARAAIAEARDRLLAQAARIDDPNRQKTFLEDVPENARTLSLAQAWLADGARG